MYKTVWEYRKKVGVGVLQQTPDPKRLPPNGPGLKMMVLFWYWITPGVRTEILDTTVATRVGP